MHKIHNIHETYTFSSAYTVTSSTCNYVNNQNKITNKMDEHYVPI